MKHARLAAVSLSISLVSASCAHNPAVHPAPNDQELVVKTDDQGLLFRGSDALDEQDFYELAKDQTSYDAIHDSRSSGEHKQTIGGTIMVLGLAAIIGGAVNSQLRDNGVETVPEWGTYALLVGGLLGLVYGGGMYRSGKALAHPSERMFDAAHAQSSLEVMRYGAGGLTAESIKKLELQTADTDAMYCAFSGTRLAGLEAKDKMGFKIKIEDHMDWLEWSSTPAELVHFPKVSSPLRSTLASFGTPVEVEVKVKGTSVGHKLSLKQSFACLEELGGTGETGQEGATGKEGSTNSDGGPGSSASAGGDGPDVEVEVAHVIAPNHEKMLLVVRKHDSSLEIALVKGSAKIFARGGRGGSGGAGGAGGHAGGCGDALQIGGNGGRGGDGGAGGRGGRVTIRGATQAAISALTIDVEGGEGGAAGEAGRGGNSGDCHGGRSGNDGTRGNEGTKGAGGSHTASVARDLPLISEALATNPAFTLAK